MTDRETNTLAARGMEELFSICAVVSVFGSVGKKVWFGDDGQTIFMDSRLSEIWQKLALHYFPADCFGIDFF
jgi:hypothetical protein